MKVGELFDIKYGINLELNACEIVGDDGGVNFVARTSENNGVVAKVKPIEGKIPQPAGVITCAGGGSVLSAFVQKKPFYSGRDLYILTPKQPMSLEEKLFYCHAIKMNAYRYGYGRQANRTLKDINLPPLSKWLKNYKMDYTPITTEIKYKDIPLDMNNWQKFNLRDVFNFKRGKGITKEEIDNNPGGIPCIQGGESYNGILGYMNSLFIKDNKYVYAKGPFLSLARVGSSGCINVQKKDCYIGDKAIALKLKSNDSVYVYIFISTILNLEKYRYTYGRGVVIEDYINKQILLPVDKNRNPDWAYMESYIKSLPHSDNI